MLRSSIVAGIAALALAAAGCGGGSSDATGTNPDDGKQIFTDAGCAGCHTLSAAGSNGGTSLDNVKLTAPEVERQVTNGGGGMPSFSGKLTATQITAVSEFVAANDGSQPPPK